MSEHKVVSLSTSSLRPVQMTPRVHLATQVQMARIDKLMRVLARLSLQGFAPIGFMSNPIDGMRIEIEMPPEALLDGRSVAGKYQGGVAEHWFTDEGVRVCWYPLGESA